MKEREERRMKVLVTGGAGFIGSNIVDQLVQEGHAVVVVDNLYRGRRDYVNKDSIFYEIDIRDDALHDVFRKEKPECVIHQAAQSDVSRGLKDPYFDGSVNILGTINVLECCKKTGVQKIIYASSAAVYGNPEYLGIDEAHPIKPISFYGISKYVSEQYIRVYSELYGLKYTILRYANVYGRRQLSDGEGGVISIFLDKMSRGEAPIIYGTGLQTRDFIYVADVVAVNCLALYKGDNHVLNIGTGREVNINELVDLFNQKMNTKIRPQRAPERKGDILRSYFQNQKAKKILGWTPKYSIEEGLQEMIHSMDSSNKSRLIS